MPRSPRRPCRYQGCPELAEEGSVYCLKHKRDSNDVYNKYNRDPTVAKMYGTSWKKLRKIYIERHPLCENCLKEGCRVPAEEVHHIVPLSAGGKNDIDNLKSLCQSCHTKEHFKIGDRSWGRGE